MPIKTVVFDMDAHLIFNEQQHAACRCVAVGAWQMSQFGMEGSLVSSDRSNIALCTR